MNETETKHWLQAWFWVVLPPTSQNYAPEITPVCHMKTLYSIWILWIGKTPQWDLWAIICFYPYLITSQFSNVHILAFRIVLGFLWRKTKALMKCCTINTTPTVTIKYYYSHNKILTHKIILLWWQILVSGKHPITIHSTILFLEVFGESGPLQGPWSSSALHFRLCFVDIILLASSYSDLELTLGPFVAKSEA